MNEVKDIRDRLVMIETVLIALMAPLPPAARRSIAAQLQREAQELGASKGSTVLLEALRDEPGS